MNAIKINIKPKIGKQRLTRPHSILCTGQLVERKRVRLRSGRSESNRTQCCQRLATAATFFRKELCCPDAMSRGGARKLITSFRSNTAGIVKNDLIDLTILCTPKQLNRKVKHTKYSPKGKRRISDRSSCLYGSTH